MLVLILFFVFLIRFFLDIVFVFCHHISNSCLSVGGNQVFCLSWNSNPVVLSMVSFSTQLRDNNISFYGFLNPGWGAQHSPPSLEECVQLESTITEILVRDQGLQVLISAGPLSTQESLFYHSQLSAFFFFSGYFHKIIVQIQPARSFPPLHSPLVGISCRSSLDCRDYRHTLPYQAYRFFFLER